MDSPEDLFQRYYQPVVGFFKRRGFSAEESRDLAQETFLRVFRNMDSFRGESSVETWLFQVAANLYKNFLRNRQTQKRDAAEVPLPDREADAVVEERSDPLGSVLSNERDRLLREALLKLPPQMRRCVELSLADVGYRETAELMRISIQTVRSQLSEARRRLKPMLEDYVDEELRG